MELVPKTFIEAVSICQEQSSEMVSVHHEAENAAVFALASQQGVNFPIWLGLRLVSYNKMINALWESNLK